MEYFMGYVIIETSNIDRIISLYQYRFPDTWVEKAKQAMGTYTMPKDSMQGPDSPLTPFHMNADGDMWTSTTSRNWRSFGYTYPELVGNPSNETFTATLNKLYKPQAQGIGNYTNSTLPTIPGDKPTNKTTQATDWLCEVNMPSDIKISYSVRAFLGTPNPDPKKWPTDPNYVGQLASMSSSRMNSSVIVTGSIALTEALAQKYQAGELKSLTKDDVAAYLKEHFTWRIQALDFSEIPRNNPPAGLNVTVFSVPVKIPASETDVPIWNGNPDYKEDIKGNPPIYNGPGPAGTNVTLPAGDVGGAYNASSGQFVWKNATNSHLQDAKTSTIHVTSVRTQTVSIGQPASSTSLSVITSAPIVQPTRAPAGPHTMYVTSIILEYVTV